MTGVDRTSDLQALLLRLERQGFRVRPRPYFGELGVVAFVAETRMSTCALMENAVFLYATQGGWCARITPHGGRHWTRNAPDISALERVALEALRRTEVPPSLAWVQE